MYSVFKYLILSCSIVFGLLFVSNLASAQSGNGEVTEVMIKGNLPHHEKGLFGYFANDTKGNIWFVNPNEAWSFSIDSLRWTQWPSVNFEDTEVRLGYDKTKDRFIFWNVGVGKVYIWHPGETQLQRIDKSSHHRTQFGHAWFIHPKTSEIYAFGGIGYWQSRGYTVRFDQPTREWQIITINALQPYPAPRADALHTYDEQREEFHIFGGFDFRHDSREDMSVDFVDYTDYWVLNIRDRKWTQYPVYGISKMFGADKEIRSTWESLYYGISDDDNDLAWYPMRNPESPYDIRFMVFDRSRSFGALTPISLGTLGVRSEVFWYTFDESNNRFFIFWTSFVNVGNDRFIRVSTVQLPPADSTRAMMDLVRKYGSVDAVTASAESNALYWLFPVLLLPILLFMAYQRWKRKVQLPIHLASAQVTFCFIGKPGLIIDGKPVNLNLSETEEGILFWLYWKRIEGVPYQVTDDIENMFWKDAPNIDYVRKQRNKAIQSLHQQLKNLPVADNPSREWITDRIVAFDRRKREYSLQLDGLLVSSDIETEQDGENSPLQLLTTCNGPWVEDIRTAYRGHMRTSA
jgi:hypothetical protein